MAGFGASFSLTDLPAKVSSLSAERPLSLGRGTSEKGLVACLIGPERYSEIA
jgi:hypothetical protein